MNINQKLKMIINKKKMKILKKMNKLMLLIQMKLI